MHVWTARWVKHHATGNEVPQAEYTGYAGFPIRRLAGVLAGRLESTPDLLPGSVSSGRILSPVNTCRLPQAAGIAIPSPFAIFRRIRLLSARTGVIHVVTVITAKGEITMTELIAETATAQAPPAGEKPSAWKAMIPSAK